MTNYTNFHDYSHGDLRQMVQSMDSGGVMAASDPWRKATETLKQIRTALNTASADATSSWEGSTSSAFYSKMTKLANAVNNAAAYANDAAAAMQMMSEAIDTAKRDMPEEPSWLDKAGDAIGDSIEATVGVDDEDTRTTITDEKKAQAVAVMETLSSKYRATTAYLKPPQKITVSNDVEDLEPPDSSGPAALGALIMGGGMGFAGAGQSRGGVAPTARSTGPALGGSPASPKASPAGPTDPGIKGGTANPQVKQPANVPSGPGTGIDGVHLGTGGARGGATPSVGGGWGTGSGHGVSGESGGGIVGGLGVRGGTSGGTAAVGGGGLTGGQKGTAGTSGANSGPGRGSGSAGGSGRSGASAFGAGGMENQKGLGSGAGGGAGAGGDHRTGSGLARKGGGLVGETGKGGTGRQAFTEGGSGLGRSRTQGASGAAGAGNGIPDGTKAGKKEKKQAKERPDYLVEDEETWASGARVNPDVVE
ncbi:hypothetical protein AB0D08_10630 [Kitasatospora sp. NPDC048540]|uniref:WXG100 family type VII secretion target n=1 Tax=Kitasatospora sp. NPDC048540 TaxID=3155634 RepID=UPI003406E198